MKPPKGIIASEEDIGRQVIYRTAPNYAPEEGVITSIGRIGNVFVRYGAATGSQSTDMQDLDWSHPTLSDAVKSARGGDAPIPKRGFA